MLARFAPKVFFVLGCLFVSLNVDAQEKEAAKANDKPVPVLIDSIIRGDGEIRSAKFDRFLIELANRTNSKGFVLIYCGKKCQYGEVEAHIRGIESKIGNHWERENILILHGDYFSRTRSSQKSTQRLVDPIAYPATAISLRPPF